MSIHIDTSAHNSSMSTKFDQPLTWCPLTEWWFWDNGKLREDNFINHMAKLKIISTFIFILSPPPSTPNNLSS